MGDKLFAEWLLKELESKGWSQSELGRRAGLQRNVIYKTVNNISQPTPETIMAIAKALGKPPEEVYRAAGLLPNAPQEDLEGWEEFKWLLEHLNPKDREELLAIARLKMEMEEKRGKDHNAAGQQRSALS